MGGTEGWEDLLGGSDSIQIEAFQAVKQIASSWQGYTNRVNACQTLMQVGV